VRAQAEPAPAGGDLDVREGCDVVITEHRPVPLEHHYAVGDRIYPTFSRGAGKSGRKASQAEVGAARQARAGVPNPEVVMLERRAGVSNRMSRRGRPQPTGPRLRPPRRDELVPELARRHWLPAIWFVFSRDRCNDAVRQVVQSGVRLTDPRERAEIQRLVDERTADLDPADLDVLGYGPWAAGLELGVAAHHAGMVPVFKETVEELFVRGLVKVCFATETLALGINMPARTVVIERLEKWNGLRHELLTPGQFTQLTGRAGRRGLDTLGHAVVLYQRDVDFPTVASLVGRRVNPLHSSFTPSYNMAVNLLRRQDRAAAEQLLARSFAQYEADARVSGDEEKIAGNLEALEGYRANLHSDRGDAAEYWGLRRELSRLESASARERRRAARQALVEGVGQLRPGDVVAMPRGGERPDLYAIVSRSTSGSGTPLASAVTEDRKLVRLGPREFIAPPNKVGWVTLPSSGGPRQANYRKAVANALRSLPEPRSKREGRADGDGDSSTPLDQRRNTGRITELRAAIRAHPVHHDSRLPDIEVWARRTDDLAAETKRLQASVHRRTGSLVRQFDRIINVLTDLGYLTDDPGRPSPTEHGRRLAGLYAETDLVLAEAIRRGVLDGLDASALAAVASVFVYETRQKEPPLVEAPAAAVGEAVLRVETIWQEVAEREEDASLPVTRPPDPGFMGVVWRWAGGVDLEDALAGEEMTAGDFVRATKQVADLLRQLRDIASGNPELSGLGQRAHEASKALVRGVVAYSGM
ncbi:MAG: RNA helicase, partial [Nitriliruptorales bacterium]|nr:RNA helicase [Nitriliruptorales bacterium]